jgi:hypothetical protein
MENRSFFENFSELRENIVLYIETQLSLYKLIAFDKAVKALTIVITNSVVVLFLALSLIFSSAAGALYIGRLLESAELGLLIIGGGYLFLGIVFFSFKKLIFSKIIISFLLNIFFKDDDDEIENNK